MRYQLGVVHMHGSQLEGGRSSQLEGGRSSQLEGGRSSQLEKAEEAFASALRLDPTHRGALVNGAHVL